MKPNRCDCGKGLVKQPAHQEVPERIKGRTFKVAGRHLLRVGHRLVCPTHGPQRTVYDQPGR